MRNQPDNLREALSRLVDLTDERTARQLVAEIGRPSTQAELERLLLVRTAVRLLMQQAPRTQIRNRLVSLGISPAKAYRVIAQALDEGPRICLNEAAELRRDPGTLEAPQPAGLHMPTTTIDDLRSRLAGLSASRAALDLAGAKQNERRAASGWHRLREDPTSPLAEESAAGQAWRTAQSVTRAVEAKTAALDKNIANLQRLLTGAPRAAQAQQGVTTAAAASDAAARHLNAAQTTLRTLATMIVDGERAFAAATQDAAARLLATVKAGEDPSALEGASRDGLATIERAKAEAETEASAARALLEAATQRHTDAMRELHEAQADDAELQHLVMHAAYVESLARQIAASTKAGRGASWGSDPRPEALSVASNENAPGLQP